MSIESETEDREEMPFSRLFEDMYDPAVLIDMRAGKFLTVNPAAETMLGYSRAELQSMSPTDIHPHEIPRFEAFSRKVMELGHWTAIDLSCRCKDGSTLPAEMRDSTVEVYGREVILVVFRDLSERSLAELGGAVRKLTHDLRNTLTTAQLMCDRMADHSDNRVPMNADIITRAIERAVVLCEQSVQAGRGTEPAPDRERFLLVDVLDEVEATVVGLDVGETTL